MCWISGGLHRLHVSSQGFIHSKAFVSKPCEDQQGMRYALVLLLATKWDPWQISSDWLDVTQQNVSFFGIDHLMMFSLVQHWALYVIWSITMAHFEGQTKASSALLLERLLSLHDRSRGQGQEMMSKSDPSVTCYWYDITRDTSSQRAFVFKTV